LGRILSVRPGMGWCWRGSGGLGYCCMGAMLSD
jgi:hypothetical protein